MRIHEEFKLYENLWESTDANSSITVDNFTKIITQSFMSENTQEAKKLAQEVWERGIQVKDKPGVDFPDITCQSRYGAFIVTVDLNNLTSEHISNIKEELAYAIMQSTSVWQAASKYVGRN